MDGAYNLHRTTEGQVGVSDDAVGVEEGKKRVGRAVMSIQERSSSEQSREVGVSGSSSAAAEVDEPVDSFVRGRRVVPADLRQATPEQLLAAVLSPFDGDVIEEGLAGIANDLTLLSGSDLDEPTRVALHTMESRLRVLAEMHRRQVRDLSIRAGHPTT